MFQKLLAPLSSLAFSSLLFLFVMGSQLGCGASAVDADRDGGFDKSDAKTGPSSDASSNPEVCNFTNCNGCCDGNVCKDEASTNFCGLKGRACKECTAGQECFSGSCALPTNLCDSDCDGCCDGNQCLPGNDEAACGALGDACLACPTGQACDGIGDCVPVVCNASNCSGCCTENGECVVPQAQTVFECGPPGAACSECSSSALECTFGICVEDQPCLDVCTSGCCTQNGQCIPYENQQSSNVCGTSVCGPKCDSGEACFDGTCETEKIWKLKIISAIIDPQTTANQNWDNFGDGRPDPYVDAKFEGQAFVHWRTNVLDNLLTPFWNQEMPKLYKEADLLSKQMTFRVYDDDFGFDELIGQCNNPLTLADLNAGSITIPVCGTGAEMLKIEFIAQ